MFVRKKTNRSGTISVVVVSKSHGKFAEVKKFGVAKSPEEADETAPRLVEASVDVLVSGSYVFKSDNPYRTIKELKMLSK